uniref:Uncharacterized protein n=1 Tax=Sphaerodactylus townsendi TaxID=933632 RepID=A0ACB8E738_9SAUR
MVPAGGGGAPPSAGPCGAEVALRLGAAPGQASSGLLALAVLLGLGLGGGAAALLWLGALGPRLLLRRRRRRQDPIPSGTAAQHDRSPGCVCQQSPSEAEGSLADPVSKRLFSGIPGLEARTQLL